MNTFCAAAICGGAGAGADPLDCSAVNSGVNVRSATAIQKAENLAVPKISFLLC